MSNRRLPYSEQYHQMVCARPQPARRECCAPNASGFTLVELMVALTVGLLLIIGTAQLYLMTTSSFSGLEAASRLVENGRTAMELMGRSIRLARYFGCSGVGDETTDVRLVEASPPSQPGMTMQGIYGIEGGDQDEITVFFAEEGAGAVVTDITDSGGGSTGMALSAGGKITVSDASAFSANDYVSIADCEKADVFEISAVNGSVLTIDAGCSTCTQVYDEPAVVHKVTRHRYYLSNGGLYLSVDGGTGQELIEGAEKMEIYYGQDIDGTGSVNRYVTATVVNAQCVSDSNTDCWRQVRSVRVSLLLRTISSSIVTETDQTYQFDGTSSTASDGQLRREFTTIVSLRNHLL